MIIKWATCKEVENRQGNTNPYRVFQPVRENWLQVKQLMCTYISIFIIKLIIFACLWFRNNFVDRYIDQTHKNGFS